jgi:hypothetical protein
MGNLLSQNTLNEYTEIINTNKEEINKLNLEIVNYTNLVCQHSKTIEELTIEKTTLSSNNQSYQDSINDLNNDMKKYILKMNNTSEEILELTQQNISCENIIKELKFELEESRTINTKYDIEIEELTSKNLLLTSEEILELTQQNISCENIIKELKFELEESRTINTKDEIEDLTSKNLLLTCENKKLHNKILVDTSNLLNKENNSLTESNNKLTELNTKLGGTNKTLSNINTTLTEENSKLTDQNKILIDDNTKLTNTTIDLDKENKLLTENIQQITEENKKLTNENRRLTEKNKKLLDKKLTIQSNV